MILEPAIRDLVSGLYNRLIIHPDRNRYRWLGAIEGMLISLGVIDPNVPLPIIKVDSSFRLLFFKIRDSRNESYYEVIMRLTKNYLERSVP